MGRSRPIVDTSQDWLLISGEEDFEGDDVAFTTLEFARFLTTCDEYDRDMKVYVVASEIQFVYVHFQSCVIAFKCRLKHSESFGVTTF